MIQAIDRRAEEPLQHEPAFGTARDAEVRDTHTSAVAILLWVERPTSCGKCDRAEAQFNLGVRYLKGSGVPKDATKAVEFFRLAADQGHAEALCFLGGCYFEGNGVPEDATKAVEFFKLAAHQGRAEAWFALCVCYVMGYGVPKDATKMV